MEDGKPNPPKAFLRFFRWYCLPRLVDHIEGDLIEVYRKRVSRKGKRSADVRFIIDVLKLMRPGIVRPVRGNNTLNTYGMYKSYFKIGWRNLAKNKGYSFINIVGLATGMAVAMLIGLWIYDELQFNKYHTHYNRIARVMRSINVNDEVASTAILPSALGDELRAKYGNYFDQVVMAWGTDQNLSTIGEAEEVKLALRGYFIETGGPEMFTLKILQGSSAGLHDPHSILISQSTAKALFGDGDPIGKFLKMNNSDRMDVKVVGIYEDLPYSSDFHDTKFFAPFELFVSVNSWLQQPSFTNDFLSVYVLLNEHANFELASQQIKDVILDNISENKSYVAVNPQLALHPMKDWHLRSEWKNGVIAGGAIQIVRLFGVVGGFVLLLACINFMNLSTARSEKRAKEVGIRKTVGSVRGQLMKQFFIESLIVVGLAFVIALAFVTASLHWFNELAGKQMEMPWANVNMWLISVAFVLFTGLLAGSYPAIYLSSFNAVKVLKGSIHAGRSASLPRKVLVVMQFTVSITLIIGTVVVYQQIQYAKNRPVGYNREGLIMVPISTGDFYGKHDVIATELKNSGVVLDVSESSGRPTSIQYINGGFDWQGKDPAFVPNWATVTITPEYGKTVGWQMISGRDFSREIASDSAGFIINEAAARILGFQNPLGESIRWQNGWRSKFTSFTVIGVVKDMVVNSPYSPSIPSVFFLSKDGTSWFNIRLNPQISTSEALPKIEAAFNKIVPHVPFDYKFADQEYALKFAAEERVGKLSTVFAVLAIFISCLGLFGLASYVGEQRTKEIGIRKVVGASIFNLWRMISQDFVVLVVVSCLIAIPVSYYFLTGWLKQYEYRVQISWWVFVVTSLVALVIALLTVSYQAVKAASMKPVNSLRSD